MNKVLCRSLVLALGVTFVASAAFARHTGSGALSNYDRTSSSPKATWDNNMAGPNSMSASAAAGTTVLYSQTFQIGATCDAGSWTTVDLTAQLGSFFHVDDYAGLNASNFAPLAGTKSLWVGARVDPSGPLCGYLALPGYGNAWNQAFCTKNCIAVSGDGILDVSFLARFDSEPSYDYSSLEYTTDCSGTTGWTTIDGGKTVWTGKIPATNWIAGAAYGGSYNIGTTGPVKVRLHFQSDGAWSDEDALWNTNGGAHYDNLSCEGLATEDFEGEAVGALSTNDWENCTPPGYGNYLALFQGIQQVQEDPCARDLSCLWAAILNSSYNYACGGFPAQAAVPFGNADGQYLNNEIWSPDIPLTGTGAVVDYQFTVYRDEPLDNLIFYVWHVRSKYGAGTCPGPWKDRNFVYYGGQKDWLVNVQPMGDLIDLAGASDIQIALGVVDMCGAWCGVYGSGACHGHAPLLDQVKVYRVDTGGAQWSIRDIDQFQDNFATDGTLTGTVRADMANDVLASSDPNIIPGDSAVVKVADPIDGLDVDPGNGKAAVYCYVAVNPAQANKSGAALTQDPVRWPVVGTMVDGSGVTWTCVQLDSSIVNGVAQPDFYCVDLNDNLFTPGDTVNFFYAAKSLGGAETYAYGSNLGAQSGDVTLAEANPSEFTCLPAGGYNRGGDVLYVDGMDGRGAQPYWDTAMHSIGTDLLTDRYDVRGPSSGVSNRPSSRVQSVSQQLVGVYRKIVWDTGDLDIGLGDGSGTPEKTDDYQMLDDFLNQLTNPGGVYISGDDAGQVLASYAGTGAVTFRTTYLTYNLITGNAAPTYGIAPTGVPRVGGCYTDSFIIFAGCPLINDFDVFEPTGTTTMEIGYGTPATTNGAVIANQVVNGNGATVGVVLSGFSFIYIKDNDTDGVSDRAQFLHDTLTWLGNVVNDPTAAGPALKNSLSQNYPNPFNPQTTIAFSIKDRSLVSLKVYNVAGQLVRTLANNEFPAGAHTKVWDGRNDAGQPVSSGVYFYKLISNSFSQTKKMVLLK